MKLTSTCCVCVSEVQGGLSTNGDPYGDRKKHGLPTFEWRFYCWKCANIGYAWAEELEKEVTKILRERGLCGFLEAWVGRCTNPQNCARHSNQKCFACKKQAVKNCSHAGMLVCGMPECADHTHKH